jgi:hypothetical protein
MHDAVLAMKYIRMISQSRGITRARGDRESDTGKSEMALSRAGRHVHEE